MANNVDLLPTDLKKSYARRRQAITLVSRFSIIFILLLELTSILSLTLNLQAYLALKLSDRKMASALLLWEEKREEEKNLRAFQKKAAVFRKVNEERRTYSGVLKTLTERIPNTVILNQLQLSQEKVKISAQTASVLAFASLIDKLLSSPGFHEVVLTESEYLAKEKLYKISLEIPLIAEVLFR